MSYAATHGRARDLVTRKGAAVTFTLTAPGTYDGATDTWSTPTAATVSGSAVRATGDPKQYEALGLTTREPVTLVFAPSTYGDTPAVGSTVSWNSATYTVRWVSPISPDGTAIVCRVVVAK